MSRFRIGMVLAVGVLILGGMIFLNRYIHLSERSLPRSSQYVVSRYFSADSFRKDRVLAPEIVCRRHIERGSEFVENVFSLGTEEIARQKVWSADKKEWHGRLPDGKVKFQDDTNGTYGEERYQNNLLHGSAKSHFADGRLKSEAEYWQDDIVWIKEFYASGRLRMEVDLEGARPGPHPGENGQGKLYYPDGMLKYEWAFSSRNPIGYRKSYNSDGSLRAETYYDENNQIIKSSSQ